MYKKVIKRILDFIISFSGLILLSPVFLILIILGAVFMRGNPFFTQKRPGKDEQIFNLIKFRTMDNRTDQNGKLLPDHLRLNRYGRFLRKTSLDELPELINIVKGDMSLIGPRPLLIEYLPWYNSVEKHRHDVRPGLTGWAQVNGRNCLEWDKRFQLDVEYVRKLSFSMDVKIFFMTIKKVLCKSDIAENTNNVEGNFARIRKAQIENKGE